jgi:hypothetical protein
MPTEITAALLEVLCGSPSLDPFDSALEAIALHFRHLSGLGGALAAYPEHNVTLDLTNGPLVTATYVSHQRDDVAPSPVDNDPRKRLWHIADLLISVQLDLWGDYRSRRADYARIVEDALHNRMPWQEGLYLVSSAYHGRQLMILADNGRNTDEPAASEVGEWRRTWMLSVQTDMVRDILLPTQDLITIRPTSGADIDVTDPDTDLT